MEIWWRRAAISAWRAVWVRNVEAKSVNSAMKTGLMLKLDDLINWCNSRVFSPDEVFGNVLSALGSDPLAASTSPRNRVHVTTRCAKLCHRTCERRHGKHPCNSKISKFNVFNSPERFNSRRLHHIPKPSSIS